MREIKFRAYFDDLDVPRMIEWEQLQDVDHWWLKPSPTQFTGLKDKNGREIYEGDILRKVATKEGKKDFGETIKAVRWTSSRNGWNFTYGEQWEIIGNIYENPQLLEQRARRGDEVTEP